MATDIEALWRSLQPLRSVACWLMTGAHPDDEWSGFLAWLAFGRGVHTVFACATRGEGGQNALGPERGAALAALRSREMECAAAEIGLGVRWFGAGPARGMDDAIYDFGFSKSADDTLARWGEARLISRLVRLIRAERPDALSPTFLDVPGQHGHHRAVTRCTLRAAEFAADPAFVLPEPVLPIWRVAKIYLPAFSGGGGSYDDREPPPPATISVDLGEHCEALAMSWAQLGENSRKYHASQGMGRAVPTGKIPLRLHLLRGVADQERPMDGVPHSVGDLADTLPDGVGARALREADTAIAEAVAAWPDTPRVATAAHRALGALDRASMPAGADDIVRRLHRKRRQLGRAAALALGIGAEVSVTPEPLRAGAPARLVVAVRGPADIRLRLPDGWQADGHNGVSIPASAAPFGTLRDAFDPLGGNEPLGVSLSWTHAGSQAALDVDPPEPSMLAPNSEVSVTPRRLVRRADSFSPVLVPLTGAPPPPTWPVRGRPGEQVEIAAPLGRSELPSAGTRLVRFRNPHVGATGLLEPATVTVLHAPIAIDADARVGVVAGDADETLGWLQQLDIAAEAVDDATLAHGDMSRFTTLLIGCLAFGQRPALLASRDRLVAWTRAGGSLVTLYHRPGDGWHEGRTPPLRLLVSLPSYRWRVTNPAAPVTVLAPQHALLNTPNRINPADWDGWVRERGLYFASEWHSSYSPLLQMSDPDEPPLRGALLAAPVGAGRHVHVALALHHQFTALVPGAFRLLANLVAHPGQAVPGPI